MNKHTQLIFEGEEAKRLLLYGFQSDASHIIPPHGQPGCFRGDGLLWLLPARGTGNTSQKITCGAYRVKRTARRLCIWFDGPYQTEDYPARPACDFSGRRFSFELEDGKRFEAAFAHFYWDNQLNQIAERTLMRKKPRLREGYVLSTLEKKAYAGTYPAVDHEFHMKGRLAVGGVTEEALIRRMLELQLNVMRADNKGLSRNVCSVQPGGRREYSVWRRSRNHQCRAQMFRITANIEFMEGVYNDYAMTKDRDFLRKNLEALEANCSYIERFIRADGLLDSHVYYEDQVIKDGPVLQAQLFAVHSLRLMAELEALLGRQAQSSHYASLAELLGAAAARPYPDGFWDGERGRFIDWIDSKGEKHDHLHLLANELPELFGIATPEQVRLCRALLDAHRGAFQRFPSFVAARIEDYTESEIGTGGPYDLCAAGRYWCWDAEYSAYLRQGQTLRAQLLQVAAQAEQDGYFMGERYDMNHVYYNTGDPGKRVWHGAARYYEYPNVFQYVLICLYLGIRRGFDCDLTLNPLFDNGTVTLETYGIRYTVHNGALTQCTNLGVKAVTVTTPWGCRTVLPRQTVCFENRKEGGSAQTTAAQRNNGGL